MADTLMVADEQEAPVVRSSVAARELVGRSASITRAHELVRRAALAEGGILIVAERGVDVESVARELHDRKHSSAPYVRVECGAGDSTRLERLLFGDPAESPTDLESVSSASRIAAALGGTLFLQEVGDMPAAVQARLARVARDGEVRIDGEPTATKLRLIAGAAPGIEGDVHANRFRADLYRRLAVCRIDLPSLRDRAEDVPALAVRLLEDLCVDRGLASRAFTQPALALLSAITWPGNLAELAGLIERVVISSRDDGHASQSETIHVEDLLPALRLDRAPATFAPSGNLREARLRFERDYIARVLQHHGWRMADAAQTLGIQRPNLYRKARQLGIPVARVSE